MPGEVEGPHLFVSDFDFFVKDADSQLGGYGRPGFVVVVRMKLSALSISVRGSPAQFLLIWLNNRCVLVRRYHED